MEKIFSADPKHFSNPEQPVMAKISIVIVSYQSQPDLEICLPSLFAQTFTDIEVIVVDNYQDSKLEAWLQAQYPQISYFKNQNTGYAGGNNLGALRANGDYLLLLNPDTHLDPDALQQLYNAACGFPKGLITAKLLSSDGTINALGNEMHYTGLTTCKALGEDSEEYHGIFEVPLLSGAALMVSKTIFETLGGFDETYFMYLEDTDFSLRARLQGYTLLCVADAKITHFYKLGMNSKKFYYLERNRLLTLFKIYTSSTLRQISWGLFLTELATWLYAFLKGWMYLKARWQGYAWLWQERHHWKAQRKMIQQQRLEPDSAILADSLTTMPYDQLIANARLAQWLNRLTGPLYRLGKPSL